jgi:hypothetical protein
MIKKLIILNLLFLLPVYSQANSLANSLTEINTKLHVRILYDSIVEDSWASITYDFIKDSARLKNYLELLEKEYVKYPDNYFEKVGIEKIVLGRNLKYKMQNRAAVPDPYKNSLFLSIDGAYGDSSNVYLIHVMHHELNHCVEYAQWRSMKYKWKKWRKINPFFFRYIGAGADAYKNLEIDWYKMAHQKKGFVNLYSTTAQEEDRSEIVALIMSDEERKFLFRFCEDDKKLKKKVLLMLKYLDGVSHTSTNYWTDATIGIE